MVKDILKEMDDDFEDDAMEENIDDSLEDASSEKGKLKSLLIKMSDKIKTIFKQVLGSKKAVIISVSSLVLLIGLVMGVWLFFPTTDPEKVQDVNMPVAGKEEMNKRMLPEEGFVFEDIVDLEPFEHIQLKAGSAMGLISMNLSLELTDPRYKKQVYTLQDRIRKIVTGQVEEMTWLELRSPEGKIMLKYSLLKRINSIFPKAFIRNIYFTYFIIQ